MRRRRRCAGRRRRRRGGSHSAAAPCSPETPRRVGPHRLAHKPLGSPPRHTSRRCRSGRRRGRGRAEPWRSPPRRAGSSPICQVPRPRALTLSPDGNVIIFMCQLTYYPSELQSRGERGDGRDCRQRQQESCFAARQSSPFPFAGHQPSVPVTHSRKLSKPPACAFVKGRPGVGGRAEANSSLFGVRSIDTVIMFSRNISENMAE